MALDEDAEWTAYEDLHLIHAMGGLRVVGVNYSFCLAVIAKRYANATQTKVDVEKVRNRLKVFYDFEAAAKLVGEVQFPNEVRSFELPPSFSDKLKEKKAAIEKPKRVSKGKGNLTIPKTSSASSKTSSAPSKTSSAPSKTSNASSKPSSASSKTSTKTPKGASKSGVATPKTPKKSIDKETPASQNKRQTRSSLKNEPPKKRKR